MKNLKIVFVLIVLSCAGMMSCKKQERELNENISAIGALSMPNNQLFIKLTPANSLAVQQFRWTPAGTEDGGLILYEVVFDKSTGDFSNPAYRVVADGGGTQTQVTISHKDLTKIAAACGVGSSSTGSIKWTVVASKASNRMVGKEARTLEVERPAGFAEVPAELYLTGAATEAGDDVTKAIKLKKTEDGVFEVYTLLKPGTYKLVDKRTQSARSFYADGALLKEGTTGITVSGTAKVFYLKYDFNLATVVEVTEIQSIGLYMSAYASEIGQLTYNANGIWQSGVIPVEFYQFSWGRDERYKFALHTSAGVKYFGSSNVNNVSPVGQPASYFYLNLVTNDQWNNTYKFNPSADRKTVRVTLSFNADAPYTHTVTTL